MRYVIGVDGGGTKTTLALATEQGQVVDVLEAGCSNHQICGLPEAQRVIGKGIQALLSRNRLETAAVCRVAMGLAGADFEGDILRLTAGLTPLLGPIPFEILNDVWLPLAAQAPEGNAAVSICGTGHNTAVRTQEGKRYGIAALTYPMGNFGGGRMLTRMALHAGFRAYEGTGDETRLVVGLPPLFACRSMEELMQRLYLKGETEAHQAPVPQLVFSLAQEGDGVARQLLTTLGSEQGRMTGGLLQKAGIEDEKVQVVLAGSLYANDQAGLLIQAYHKSLQSHCPLAALSLLACKPIVGALWLALHKAGKERPAGEADRLVKNLRQTCANC